MKRLFVAKIIVPLTASIVLLVFLYLNEQLPRDALVYVGFTYFIWIVAAWWTHDFSGRRVRNTIKSADYDQKEKSVLSQMTEVEKYYVRLLHSMDQAAEVLVFALSNTQESARKMHLGVQRAHELAKNTGLLASNAMMSASACGEVGRGFVSVSKDLVKISERSEKDLVRLDHLLTAVNRVLGDIDFVSHHPSLDWIEAQLAGEDTQGILMELEDMLMRLHGYQETLCDINEHYDGTSQLDVRWLQLGEAIKRVISELNLSLDSLAESAEKFAKEMRILQISDKLGEAQLLEIKEGLMKTEQLDKNLEEIAT